MLAGIAGNDAGIACVKTKFHGPRSFDSFEAYAKEAAMSRLQAGIHYRFSMDEGLKQGKKVSDFVNQ